MAETGYMSKTSLITPAQVVAEAFSDSPNFDVSFITTNDIKIVALKHLKEVLGHEFFMELVTENDTAALSAVNTKLMNEYLKITLAYLVKYEKITDIHYRQTNQGVVTTIDDISNTVDSRELAAIKEDIYQTAKVLMDDMVWHLEHTENKGKFPTYDNSKKHTKGDRVDKVSGILFYDNKRTSPLSSIRSINNISKND